jgi:hypothetical protein
MAIFRVITFFIHAMVAAMASMLVAVFTHVIPAMVAVIAVVAVGLALCTSCGLSGLAFWRKREKDES